MKTNDGPKVVSRKIPQTSTALYMAKVQNSGQYKGKSYATKVKRNKG